MYIFSYYTSSNGLSWNNCCIFWLYYQLIYEPKRISNELIGMGNGKQVKTKGDRLKEGIAILKQLRDAGVK